ncbi:MAG: anaphase promoting complex subunit doc1 [Alectoria sarmentosa]|nr:MAG: anaphase promoting complex subunit doc1 [Alectoria sarmentosa]
MNSMNDTTSNNGDEAENPESHLQEVVDDVDLDSATEGDPLTLDPTQDPSLSGLREISSLASWSVSTHKPSCGVDALRNLNPSQFWQSDGPQPHLLTIHFFKLVKIVKIRVYLDFLLDESYTPTKMQFWGGTGMYDLVQFYEWRGDEPRGWVDVDLEGVGVGGKVELRAFVVQVRVLENHQNGKDTHVRGVQIFAQDDKIKKPRAALADEDGKGTNDVEGIEAVGMEEPDWMQDPEIR